MLKKRISISAKHLRQRIIYNPDTGIFVWKPVIVRLGKERFDRRWNTMYAGKQAGYVWTYAKSRTKYINIGFNKTRYLAHRLAFLYMTGEFPSHGIDHKDGNGLNNRWNNLRPATQSQNKSNSRLNKNNKTGYKGVFFHKQAGKYCASIGINGKRIHLGLHDNPESAHIAYQRAAKKHFGEFTVASSPA